MRPVNKGVNIPPYSPITTLTFIGANATAIKALLNRANATNVPIADCQGLWLRQAAGFGPPPPPATGTAAQLKSISKAIATRIGAIYKTATVPLTQRIGPFCSYCGSPLPGLAEVEHCVPESEYPTFSTSWDNFLLACGPCNNKKSDDPTRANAKPWTGVPAPTEAQYYDAIRNNHYNWPDLNPDSYRWMSAVLQYLDPLTNLWTVMAAPDAYNPNNEVLSTNIATREVVARIYDPIIPANFVDRSVRVLVQEQVANGRSIESIYELQLNDTGNLASTYDRRVMNRTIAWFTCMKYLKNYINAPDPVTKKTALNFIEMASAMAGFYPLWVQILNAYDPPTAVQFVADTNIPLLYPGTVVVHVP